MSFYRYYGIALLLLVRALVAEAGGPHVLIPAGKYRPFFKEISSSSLNKGAPAVLELQEKEVDVSSFYLDRFPVTNLELNAFLAANAQYRKSKILPLFAESRYLQSWKSDLLSSDELRTVGNRPATEVSWFVARRYCQAKGKRLPTITEWEYAGDVTNPEVLSQLLAWYAKTGDWELDAVGRQKPNIFGVYDMHGLIWEWVEDFNAVMISTDSRSKGDRTVGLFCGAGSINATDSKEYATFMRYGFRSGLRGDYCLKTLGFRCALDVGKEKAE